MFLKKIHILTITLFLLFDSGVAQESWNLNKCIDFAIENNLDHKTFELSEQSAKIDATQAKFNLLPAVSASSGAGFNFGQQVSLDSNGDPYKIDTQTFGNSYRLNSNINLFNGFTQLNRITFYKYRHEAAKWQKINYEDDLAFNIMMAYYDVVYYKGLVEIANEQLDLSGFNLKKTQTQIETGLKAKADLAEMQAIYEKEQLNLIQSENMLEQVKLNLSQQMNLPIGSLVSFNFDDDEGSVTVLDYPIKADSLFYSFVEFSPYVKMANAELRAEEKNLAIAKGRFSPSLSLNANMNTGYSETNRGNDGKTIPFKDQIDNNMNQYVGASLSIPVFSRNQIRSDVRKAKIAKEQASTRVENFRKAVYFELKNDTREIKALFREYHQTKKQVEADNFAYRVAERKYDEGIIDVIELLTVKNRLASSQSQLLRSKTQWQIKNKILDFYMGVRFWKISPL